MKERATFVKDIYNEGKFLLEAPISYDEKASKSLERRNFYHFKRVNYKIRIIRRFLVQKRIKEEIHHLVEEKGLGFGKVMMPLRLSLVGELKIIQTFQI